MVAWYWILISVIVTNFLTTHFFYEIDFEKFWERFLLILIYPFVWVGSFPYVFFRNFFIPATQQRFEKAVAEKREDETIHKISKSVYLWHNRNSKKKCNMWFLVRVK